jgi:hypothetical protein
MSNRSGTISVHIKPGTPMTMTQMLMLLFMLRGERSQSLIRRDLLERQQGKGLSLALDNQVQGESGLTT